MENTKNRDKRVQTYVFFFIENKDLYSTNEDSERIVEIGNLVHCSYYVDRQQLTHKVNFQPRL